MEDLKRKARGKAIDEEVASIRARLDQLVKTVESEKLQVNRNTTEALTEELTSLTILEEEARKLRNSQVIGRVTKERDRAREALGITIKRRR